MPIDKKKIARNTLALYIRMFITTIITFYTSRVVLNTLGIDDFGTYSAVGSIALMFSFLSGSLSSSCARYITIAIGKNDSKYTTEVFSISVKSHVFLGIVVILLSEIAGMWLIKYELNIPPDALGSAIWVLQFAIFSAFFSVINIPYEACVIADERMAFFAYLNIFGAIAKLGISFLIILFPNRLVSYAGLLFLLTFSTFAIDRIYCRRSLQYIRYDNKVNNRALLKEIALFSWWNIVKYGAIAANGQINVIFINIWGGITASAAMGIFQQVNSGIVRFYQSFQGGFGPQITKNWAQKDILSFNKLITNSAKYSSVLLFIPAIPLSINMDSILHLWLGIVPENTALFCQIGLICVWFEAMTLPIEKGVMSIGNIRNYQLISSVIWLISIPVVWGLLYLGMSFKYILLIKLIFTMITFAYTLCDLSNKSKLNLLQFIDANLIRPSIVIVITYLVTYKCSTIINDNVIISIAFTTLLSTVTILILTYLIGLTATERSQINNLVKFKLNIYSQ